MNPLKFLIQSNIFISLAAVSLTVETQVQLSMKPHWQPYFLFIFFAVLFEYHLHQLLSVLTGKEVLKTEYKRRTRKIRKKIFFLASFSGVGLFGSVFFVNIGVLFIFIPIALLTLLYSYLIFGKEKYVSWLRKIPFLKNFLIAVVWSAATVLLPVFQLNEKFSFNEVFLIFLERFFFIFALSIPFDIRDIEADKRSGLKTVPILLNTQKALNISYLSLGTFFMISLFHYRIQQSWFLVAAFGISALSTYLFISLKYFKNRMWYYDGILDGTIIFQAILVFAFYFITHN
jgi:4-hydroxybenzoate polyprenyltransferase